MCSDVPNGKTVEPFLLVDEKEQIINAIGGEISLLVAARCAREKIVFEIIMSIKRDSENFTCLYFFV
jgi:hypothetical protein